jgi:hypothetical protein
MRAEGQEGRALHSPPRTPCTKKVPCGFPRLRQHAPACPDQASRTDATAWGGGSVSGWNFYENCSQPF